MVVKTETCFMALLNISAALSSSVGERRGSVHEQWLVIEPNHAPALLWQLNVET